ncbi:MAG: hypothetical protein MUC88_00435 [Planctomycetes bacterium]|jgi:hypothetical protein|nr:hypothetical protein [Planctomycetota bacterium]
MIVTFPSAPMGPNGKTPRPMGILLGSYGNWQLRAAEELEPRAGCIVCGAWPEGAEPEVFLRWLVPMIEVADASLIWIDSPSWSEWEFGYLLGLCRNNRARSPVVGVSGTFPSAAPALAGALRATGINLDIHADLGMACSAMEAELRCIR